MSEAADLGVWPRAGREANGTKKLTRDATGELAAYIRRNMDTAVA